MSEPAPTSALWVSRSGAMYPNVPMLVPVLVSLVSVAALARPKSPPGGLGFAEQPLAEHRVVRVGRGHQLDGNLAFHDGVFGFVHLAEPAGPQQADQPVLAEL